MRLTEQQIINRMHRAYLRRLHEVLGEADVKDKRGNVVISPDLKVRHIDSGFEYTVGAVEQDPDTGGVTILLREPEVPRFDSAGEKFVGETSEMAPTDDVPHDELVAQTFDLPSSESRSGGDRVFDVSEEEFEDEYRVNPRGEST